MNWLELYVITGFVKLLLFHSYHSTDFEVHRNWLAITNSLPIQEWYYEATSQWTLDYPPFFAWFEYVLSHFAKFVDPDIVNINKLNYSEESARLFQRISVVISDIVLCVACARAANVLSKQESESETNVKESKSETNVKESEIKKLVNQGLMVCCYLCCAALLIVDHIHFQYNGFLSGVFLLSIVNMMEGNLLSSGLYFSLLLNLKHIYLYVAPVYFTYMLRVHLDFSTSLIPGIDFIGLVKLGAVVIVVFAASFGPFISHLPQVLSRLFPVQRGLCHAYWAPNFWTFYNMGDVVLSKIGKVVGLVDTAGTHPLMSGLVQVSEFVVLPNVTTLHCGILTLLSMLPALYKTFTNPTPLTFLKATTAAALCSYMFGYHVHEKAILVVIVPYGMLVFLSPRHAADYLFLSLLGTYSLSPLLYQPQELLIKICIFVMVHSLMYILLKYKYPLLGFSPVERLYLVGLVPHFCVVEALLPVFLPQFEFLPLLLMSVYCSVGFVYAFVRVYLTM